MQGTGLRCRTSHQSGIGKAEASHPAEPADADCWFWKPGRSCLSRLSNILLLDLVARAVLSESSLDCLSRPNAGTIEIVKLQFPSRSGELAFWTSLALFSPGYRAHQQAPGQATCPSLAHAASLEKAGLGR